MPHPSNAATDQGDGRSVLGIDAAWTAHHPSGIALVRHTAEGWRCELLAPSYDAFIEQASGHECNPEQKAKGSRPDPAALLRASRQRIGSCIDCIAVDMPLAMTAITSRRAADTAIASRYGSRGCAVHSPSAQRPGAIADRLRAELETLGYRLQTADSPHPGPALIEVYPHVALLTLLNLSYRLPYKVSRSGQYWKAEQLSISQRIERLLSHFQEIRSGLDAHITGIPPFIPRASEVSTLASLKPIEDMLDALICAWVGIEHLEGRTLGLGDHNAAIWVPAAGAR